jgi:hypothetical protein
MFRQSSKILHVKCVMGLEKLDFKDVKRYLWKIFGHILKANNVKHHVSQMQPDLMILKAPKCEKKTLGF